jgi:hypothetical protein
VYKIYSIEPIDVEGFTAITQTRSRVPETEFRTSIPGAGGLTAVGGGLTADRKLLVVRRLAPVALDRFSGRDPIGRSSPKCCRGRQGHLEHLKSPPG